MISKSNHVKFTCFVLLGVTEEAKKITSIFSVQCIIKQLLDSVFVIFRIIEVEVGVIITLTETSSNNCLLSTGHDPQGRYMTHVSVRGYHQGFDVR